MADKQSLLLCALLLGNVIRGVVEVCGTNAKFYVHLTDARCSTISVRLSPLFNPFLTDEDTSISHTLIKRKVRCANWMKLHMSIFKRDPKQKESS